MCCVCLLSVLATPTHHHHGHSCLRLRVFVCCSTGETRKICLSLSIRLLRSFYTISSLSVSLHLPSPPICLYLANTEGNRDKDTHTYTHTHTEKLRSDSPVSERGFSASCCLGRVLMMAYFTSKQCFETDGLMLLSVSVLLQ